MTATGCKTCDNQIRHMAEELAEGITEHCPRCTDSKTEVYASMATIAAELSGEEGGE